MTVAAPAPLPKASPADTLRILLLAAGPLFAKGLIRRRPAMVRFLARTDAEARGIALLARLRAKYGEGPLRLAFPLRGAALILSPRHLRRLLAETPEPFAADTPEKRASLAHFQPRGVLVSSGAERAERRRFNEAVLETGCPVHSLAPALIRLCEGEAASLLARGGFAWPEFQAAWFRMVRAAIFGPAARDDEALTAMLHALRGDANWAFLKPRRRRLRRTFLAAVGEKLRQAPADSLAGLARARATPEAAPEDQIAHWLFAFDAAAIGAFRTLAMLALHPDAAARARRDRPFVRAAMLDTLRLWPTTPAVLRRSERDTDWEGRTLPAGTGLLVHLPFFHRDRGRIPYADRFTPAAWLDGRAEAWPFVPFSAGPAGCPAANLVLLVAGAWIEAAIRRHVVLLPPGTGLDPEALPATFDHFALRLSLRPLPRSRREPALLGAVNPLSPDGDFDG
ncbi:MAG: cytochrome P450 [Alphaproteobacteria bacterium]|nr:cytochrome P450 [Alphaproteobacteria bacterium]